MADPEDRLAAREISLPLGLVVEKRKSRHPWGDWTWRPVAVFAGAREDARWVEMMSGEGWTRYHIATLPLVLHRKETEAYKSNLESRTPSIFAVLHPAYPPDAERPVKAHRVTASPYEAQDFGDNDGVILEKLSMPEPVIAWVRGFVERHHVEHAFRKRRRDEHEVEAPKFGKEPIFQREMRPDRGGEE